MVVHATSPGITVRPGKSSVFAPDGIRTSADLPIAAIFSPSSTMVESPCAGVPVPSMIVTLVSATTDPGVPPGSLTKSLIVDRVAG
jgi:hypothetical protein